MKKQQFILIGSGLLLVGAIYVFGRTVPHTGAPAPVSSTSASTAEVIDFSVILEASKKDLTASQHYYVTQLESGIVRGDVKTQQIRAYKQLAEFWRDSAHKLIPYTYYTSEAAKLENSQKNLTFAAQLYLDGLMKQSNQSLKTWMATEAKVLFEKALELNPANDSLKVGLGKTLLFGGIGKTPMEGILLIREVADKNPKDIYAQYTLGMGSMMSGQWDKAIERFEIIHQLEPNNLEPIFLLADVNERKNDKEKAIYWYKKLRTLIDDPEIVKEVDKRITDLKN